MVTEPVRQPDVVGRNVTLIVQEAPEASDAPQVLVCTKSLAIETSEIAAATAPVFNTVTTCSALFVPRDWLPKVSEAGAVASATVFGGVPSLGYTSSSDA